MLSPNVIPVFDARQPKGLFTPKSGDILPSYETDPVTHKDVEKLIEANLMRTPAESVFQFTRSGSGIHLNIVNLPGSPG